MESDDEFETGLPRVRGDECSVGNVNLEEVLTGEGQGFHFEMPEKLETNGYSEMRQRPVESSLHPSNMRQMELKFSDLNVEEVIKVMFGDYSEIREVMTEKVTQDGGVIKRMLRPGTGKKVALRNMVRVHYMMGAEYMDDIIESTYETNNARRFRVGAGEMIPAMDLGLATMRVGEISKFLSTSDYAFGKLGAPLPGMKVIPADASVMLQVEVLEAYDSEKDNSVGHMSSAERQLLPFDELFAYAEEMKMDGNREFKTEDYDVAITYYLGALDCIQDMEAVTKEEKYNYFKLRQQLCNNLAHAYFKLGQFKRALTYAEAGTEVAGTGQLKAKSYYWCAKALYELGRYENCCQKIKEAEMLHHDPSIKKLKSMVEEKLKEAKDNEKELFARMMNAKITA